MQLLVVQIGQGTMRTDKLNSNQACYQSDLDAYGITDEVLKKVTKKGVLRVDNIETTDGIVSRTFILMDKD